MSTLLRIRKFLVKYNIERKFMFLAGIGTFVCYVGGKYLEASGFDWRKQIEKEREENPLFGRRQFPGESDEEYENSKSRVEKFTEKWADAYAKWSGKY